jgi:ureidoglycolate dehydrogenase (NAD+)
MPHYVRRLDAGSINPAPRNALERTGSSTATLDGDDGLGMVNCYRAMEAAISIAREAGTAFVSVRNSSHCGALSFFAELALDADLVAIVMTQTDSGVVPPGGRRPFFGTNPLCIAAPSSVGPPLMLDMATSTVSGGKVYAARSRNEPIPDTWALDADGRPTTDPHMAVLWTPAAGAKGFGLGAMIDVLTGILAGGCFARHIPVMYGEFDKQRKLCHLVGAVDYGRFAGAGSFRAQVAALIAEIHDEPVMEGGAPLMAPGEPEQRTAASRMRDGIPVDASLLAELRALVPASADGE